MTSESPENLLRDAVLLLSCADNNSLGRETISFVKFLGRLLQSTGQEMVTPRTLCWLVVGCLHRQLPLILVCLNSSTSSFLVTKENPFRLSPDSRLVGFDRPGNLITRKLVILNSRSVMDSFSKHFLSTYYAPAIALDTHISIRFVISCL